MRRARGNPDLHEFLRRTFSHRSGERASDEPARHRRADARRQGLRRLSVAARTKEPYSDDKFFRTVGGYKCASRDPALIEFWWSRQPEANIGLATGSVSGIWVLDLDGDEDEAWLREQETEHGENVPATVEVITAKGRHLYFRYPLRRRHPQRARSRRHAGRARQRRLCPACRRACIRAAAPMRGVSIAPTRSPTHPIG